MPATRAPVPGARFWGTQTRCQGLILTKQQGKGGFRMKDEDLLFDQDHPCQASLSEETGLREQRARPRRLAGALPSGILYSQLPEGCRECGTGEPGLDS